MAKLQRPSRVVPVLLSAAIVALVLNAQGATLPAQSDSVSGGQRQLSLEAVVPNDVFAFASVAGLDESSAAAEKLSLYGLWQEPEVQEFLGKIIAAYEREAAKAPPEAVEQWATWKELIRGRVSGALGGLTVIWTRDGPIPVPGAVVSLDLGDRRDAFQQRIDALLASDDFKREMRGVERLTETYQGHEIQVFRQTRYFPQMSICATYLDNLLLIGLNSSLLKQCIDNHRDGGRRALLNAPSFQRSRSKAAASPLLEVFLNIDGVTQRVRGLIPDEWLEVLGDLGFADINAVYYASAVQDGSGLDTLFIDAPEPRRGLLAINPGPITEATLRRVPKNAVYFETARFDAGPMYDLVWAAVAKIAPPRGLRRVERALERAERELGFKIRDGLLGALGKQILVYAELPPNTAIPQALAEVDIQDREKAAQVMGTLLQMAEAETREVPFGEHTMTVINAGPGAVVTPCFAFVEDKLVLSLFLPGLKNYLRHLRRPRASIMDSADFQATFKSLPRDRAEWIGYADAKRWAAYGYNFAETLLPGLIDPDDVPFDLAMLPTLDVILKHLGGMGGTSYSDQDGTVMKIRWPVVAGYLSLWGRFIDKAPGFPPYALGRMGRYMERSVRTGRRGAGGIFGAPGVRTESSAVNPLRPGDPREAAARRQVEELNKALSRSPDNAGLVYQRAAALHLLRRYDEAAEGFQRAYALGERRSTSAYNAACCLSLAGKKDAAFGWLETAFKAGFDNWPLIERDSDLANLRSDPRFGALVKKHRKII